METSSSTTASRSQTAATATVTADPDAVPSFNIKPVRTTADLNAVTLLFRAYVASLDLDLSFQSFETEISSMPGRYAVQVGGELLLAVETGTGNPIGCVALRCLSEKPPMGLSAEMDSSTSSGSNTIGEIKRLYTVPSSRGIGLGRGLAAAIIVIAQRLGYDELRLDTLPSMVGAQALYKSLGFVDIEPYCYNPVQDTKFLGLKFKRRIDTNTD